MEGQLVFNNIAPRLNRVLAGLGLAYLPEDQVQGDIAAGREAWKHTYFIAARSVSPFHGSIRPALAAR